MPWRAGADVQLLDRLQHADLLAVDRDRHAALEPDDDLVGLARASAGPAV